ncbi:GPI-linked NAD(P)(+)--arginine ADP-ribosyltransferase 1 isoform X2 [Misgurnus anguillicaudatus]|uniref:GPI-linked NAD(P)(+)--arginine ADP-ribosyltransferase 1 isoform X2 n=1 Tax=Misgurnus anguillicaudatus TaxID=75329 RepID=UPI003CCF6EC1
MGSMRFPALLFVLFYSVLLAIADEVIKLDRFPEFVDYKRCRDKMLQRVIKPGGLLQTELNTNKDFKLMWKANATCGTKIPGVTQEHMAALQSYADADEKFHKSFNTQLYNKGTNITMYQDQFSFKSLHFLLTDAMQLLSKKSMTCRNVYSGTEKTYNIAVKDVIRFGSFLPAKLSFNVAFEDAVDSDGTIFEITSCTVVNLDEMCKSEEIDLLISPDEAFDVEDIRKVGPKDEEITMVILKPSASHRSFDCSHLFSSSTSDESSSKWMMTAFLMVCIYTLAL